jgi:hypothetical protein
MKLSNELSKLHEEMIQYITDENNREMACSIAEKRAEAKQAESNRSDEIKSFEALGVNISNLESLELEQSEISKGEIEIAEAQMAELSEAPIVEDDGINIDASILPEGAFMLKPSWIGTFSDNDQNDGLIDASAIETQTTVTAGGGCKNLYNWASGAGGGCIGGVGKINSYVEFGFWFKPTISKFYSIRPLFQFRGYNIVKANDKWYNCKSAKVSVSAQTNCYQYNWKGWNKETVHSLSGSNINVNSRFDANRITYNSYLLAAGDWAYVRARVNLYAYAKGSGSYAKNDYSTGVGNRICVPYVIVY